MNFCCVFIYICIVFYLEDFEFFVAWWYLHQVWISSDRQFCLMLLAGSVQFFHDSLLWGYSQTMCSCNSNCDVFPFKMPRTSILNRKSNEFFPPSWCISEFHLTKILSFRLKVDPVKFAWEFIQVYPTASSVDNFTILKTNSVPKRCKPRLLLNMGKTMKISLMRIWQTWMP